MKRLIGLLVLAGAVIVSGQDVSACSGPGDTRVEAIYPSAKDIPQNALRFYVYFSAPMGGADVLSHIRLKTAEGQTVKGAFLSNRFDLWSPDRRRLTLLFDPARVKTGLKAHDAMGRALQAGQRYVLSLDGQLKDVFDCALAEPFSHDFLAGPEDLSPPDPDLWRLDVPTAATTDPIVIHLAETLDHLSLAYRLRIMSVSGDLVPGHIQLGHDETSWLFFPKAPWSAQTYSIRVDPRLEDLAGNRPGQRFDRPIAEKLVDITVHRDFQIQRLE